MCRYTDGINSVTHASTRKSLGCGSRRAFKTMAPSDPDGPQVNAAAKQDFRKTINPYYE